MKNRRKNRGNSTTKERKPKRTRRPTYQEWLFGALPGMVDNLCRKMYENESRNVFASREAFCAEYADLVVDQRRVKSPSDRVRVLDRALRIAENTGRIDIVDQGRRRVTVMLADAEWTNQRREAKGRANRNSQKWHERHLRKEKAA
jgi:hypothetical protein